MKYIKSIYLIFSLVSVLLASEAFAWGPAGHRTVGEVAQRHLTPKALEEVHRLLGTSSLADVSTWADEIRSDPNFADFAPLHFADVNPPFNSYAEQAAASALQDPKGDAVLAILEIEAYLRSNDPKVFIPIPALAKVDRPMALKLLVHFIGDLHQPLHLINDFDQSGKSIRGGNTIKVKWLDAVDTNLHSIWDTEMIEFQKLSYEKQENYQELASLVDHASAEQIGVWGTSDPMTWADESLSYRTQVFTFPDTQIDGDSISISYRYINANLDTIRLRLDQAGIRLAKTLNDIFR